MKHNNMRDIEAEIRLNARAERLKRDAKQAVDSISALFNRLMRDMADSKANSLISKLPAEDKGTLTIIQDGHFTIGEDGRLRPSTPEPMDSSPDDSVDYKVRYERAMNILETIFNPFDPPISFSETEWIKCINIQYERYEKLRDSNE